MERVLNYFRKYSPELSDAAQAHLKRHGKIHAYPKGGVYKLGQETKHKWCLLLSGLVQKEQLSPKGKASTVRICTDLDYFVGTRHPYTDRTEQHTIVFLQDSILYEIDNEKFQQAVDHHPCMSRVYHILKQHKLDQANDLAYVRGLHYEYRIYELYKRFPKIADSLTVEQARLLLEISNNRDYYTAYRYYLRQ